MEMIEKLSDANNNNTNIICKIEKYSLRPRCIVKRDEDEEIIENWKPKTKSKRRSKPKPAPLSKYRRKTANARERCRMREINDGFEALRRALPHLTSTEENNEKLTKISTLRLAMKYITALNRILNDPETESDTSSYKSQSTDQSLSSTDFSDQMLSPSDFTSSDFELSRLPLVTSDLSCFNISDFVDSTINPPLINHNSCLPELDFDDSSCIFADANHSSYDLSNFT